MPPAAYTEGAVEMRVFVDERVQNLHHASRGGPRRSRPPGREAEPQPLHHRSGPQGPPDRPSERGAPPGNRRMEGQRPPRAQGGGRRMGQKAPPRVGGALREAVLQQMKPLLLDTYVIVDVLRKRNERHALIEHLIDQGQPLASCPTTLT